MATFKFVDARMTDEQNPGALHLTAMSRETARKWCLTKTNGKSPNERMIELEMK